MVKRFHRIATGCARRVQKGAARIDNPGFEVDLYVDADLAAMATVWLGDISFESALRAGSIKLIGPRELAKAFPSWLMLSHFASVPRLDRTIAEPLQPA